MAEERFEGFSRNTLSEARDIADSMAEISSAASRLKKDLEGVDGNTAGINTNFTKIRNSADKVAQMQEAARVSSKGTAAALKEQSQNLSRVKELNLAIEKLYIAANKTTGQTQTNLLKQAQNLSAARDNAEALASTYGEIAKSSTELDKGSLAFDAMGEIASKYFGTKFSKPFELARDAAREQAIINSKLQDVNLKTGKGITQGLIRELGLADKIKDKNGDILQGKVAANKIQKLGLQNAFKSTSTLSAGFKRLGPIITKALGPLALVKLAADALMAIGKGIVAMFVGAQEQSVALARTMGISTKSAQTLRDRFRDIRSISDTTRNNIQFLVEAQKELNDEFGATFIASNKTLESQTFLTKRLLLNSAEAAKINIRFEALDQNAKKATNSILELSQNFATTNGYAMQVDKLMTQVAKVSGQTAASFGFSNENIAKGVLQVRKFGLNLMQAKNISEGLLSFESSISNELEAELLTGKQLNFEKARMMALTGDIAGATEEVMSQMENLTDEQRKNPIIMKSMAAAAGLTADELQDAYLIQLNNNKAAEKYFKVLQSGNEEEIKKWKEQSGLEQATREEIEARVTLGEQFKEAMTDVKQQFIGLVDSGVIDSLIRGIKALANFIDIFVGPSTSEKLQKDIEAAERNNTASKEAIKAAKLKLEEAEETREYSKKSSFSGMGGYGGIGFRLGANALANNKAKEGRQILNVEDFQIKTHPKDTLVMAGGTKFGEETNTLLKQLLTAVEKGGDVYMDGNKVGHSMALASNKSN